ncbi:22391_t:CDS:2 [Dentiscutata erythropus]|uniref:22391_t:CDS:1 n=1 Tax=Dentiscutata erythropus TaxID=1348616 RepID=A0A9N9ERX3_9GLOM|nr:22391_t:CDS:2 [Dentiscutata erythropus]
MASKLSKEELKNLFNTFDTNGNGKLSYSEIESVVLRTYPQFNSRKKVIMRAYQDADASKNGYIEINEFAILLDALNHYYELYDIFQKVDKDNDGRINFDEFKNGSKDLKLFEFSDAELKLEFDKIDMNRGGLILFDEYFIEGFFVFVDDISMNSHLEGNWPEAVNRLVTETDKYIKKINYAHLLDVISQRQLQTL